MTIEAMDESLNGRLVDVTDIRSRLTRLKALEDHSGANQPERVNDDFTLHGLDGVHDDGNGTTIKLLE